MRKKQTAYWVDEELLERVKRAATSLNITVSELTRLALEKYLKELK